MILARIRISPRKNGVTGTCFAASIQSCPPAIFSQRRFWAKLFRKPAPRGAAQQNTAALDHDGTKGALKEFAILLK
jgi:hypothetical protein